MNLVYYLDDTE